MNDEQHRFLALLGRPPARLTAEQTAWALNCQPHDIPILVSARLLKPLGNPAPNGPKYFATQEVLAQLENRVWLAKVSNVIIQRWHKKNGRKRIVPLQTSQNSACNPLDTESNDC